jgi:NitT/TauT family transport system permease protein
MEMIEGPAAESGGRLNLWLARFALLFCAIALWWLASLRIPVYILPGPGAVASEIIRLAQTPTFASDIFATLGRITAGFLIALAVGTPIGLVLGSSRFAGALFEPLLPIVNSLSSAIWATLAILWFGLSGSASLVGPRFSWCS